MRSSIVVVFASLLTLGCLQPSGPAPAESPEQSATPTPTPGGPVSVTGANHDIAPRGSQVVFTGTGFVNVTGVVIGGVDQVDFTVGSDTQLTVNFVETATPLGPREVNVTADEGTSAGFEIEITDVVVPALAPSAATVSGTYTWNIVSFPGFDGGETTAVAIGGVIQPVVSADVSQVTIGPIDPATPLGSQPVEIANGELSLAPIGQTVVALAINELDSATPGTDADEFVEIDAGVAGVSLDGYALVAFNGNGDGSYLSIDLGEGGAVTNADGYLLVGNANVNPDITFTDNTLQNGADAVGLYQSDAVFFPTDTTATDVGLLDALVYGTADADDPELLMLLLGDMAAVQEDEDALADADTDSVSRCNAGLIDPTGVAFETVDTPTPGTDNLCP